MVYAVFALLGMCDVVVNTEVLVVGMVGFIELVVGRIDVDCVGVMEEDCERRAVEVLSVEIVLLGGVMALVV